MVAEELLFDSTPGFGRYKAYMEQAIAHPAKMNTKLLEFLIKTHTKEGDIVLDPMAGSGSTGVISALHGRNAINVELEEKFHGWMEEARRKVEAYNTLSQKGKIANIKGDARQLSKLLGQADVILTSPPYGEAQQGQGIAKHGYQGNKHSPTDLVGKRSYMPDKFDSEENISRLPMGNIDAVITSPPYGEAIPFHDKEFLHKLAMDIECGKTKGHSHGKGGHERELDADYGENPNNIGNLPIDTIITSPPYAIDPKNICHTKEGKTLQDYDEKRGFKPTAHPRIGYSPNEENIGNLPLTEVDAVITSPPYAEVSHHSDNPKEIEHLRPGRKARVAGTAGNSENNIGQLSYVDTVITSPPYADSKKGDEDEERMASNLEKHGLSEETRRNRHTPGRLRAMKSMVSGYSKTEENIGNLGFVDSVITSPPYEESLGAKAHSPVADRIFEEKGLGVYTDRGNEDNIGNLKRETYLEAMLKVYMEMWKVLKPEGSAIVVIKPFIRNKKVVDLPWHTWLLLEKVGFKLTKLYKLHLKQDSFWRILYKKKYPHVAEIKHEYVIVCQKSPSFYG